jgi:hypothetical protein
MTQSEWGSENKRFPSSSALFVPCFFAFNRLSLQSATKPGGSVDTMYHCSALPELEHKGHLTQSKTKEPTN